MRIGLINASGTKHQMHGAAYGNGIYLSPHASVSFGYSGMGYNRGGITKTSVSGKCLTLLGVLFPILSSLHKKLFQNFTRVKKYRFLTRKLITYN